MSRSHLYADARTRAALAAPAQRILMIGSYMGYPNFGDILQLKGALRWHAAAGLRQPVLLCDADAVTDAAYADRLREYFGVEAVLFTCGQPLDPPPPGCDLYREPAPISTLHLYGGGFLNTMWGDYILSLVEAMHRRFGIATYIVSGQQVEPAFAPRLSEHFAEFPPAIVGGRDPRSVEVLKGIDAPAHYSFDDASECITLLADDLRPRKTSSDSAPHALIHLNASGYVRAEDEAAHLLHLRERLAALAAHLGPAAAVTLFQAYSDRRQHEIADSLGVAQMLEDGFAFSEYRVLQLDRLSLTLGTPSWAPPFPLNPAPTIALTCSYHVSMLCALLGVPCWMESRNGYYDQKQAALGLARASFEDFLKNPTPAPLTEAFNARTPWLDALREAIERSGGREPSTPIVPDMDPKVTARPWKAKRTAGEARREQHAWHLATESASHARVVSQDAAARAAIDEASLALSQADSARADSDLARAELVDARAAHTRTAVALEETRLWLADVQASLTASEARAAALQTTLAEVNARHEQSAAELAARTSDLAHVRAELDQTRRTLADLRLRAVATESALRRDVALLTDDAAAWKERATGLSHQLHLAAARAARLESLCDAAARHLERIVR